MTCIPKHLRLCFVFLSLVSYPLKAQWVQTGGPVGGDVSAIIAKNDKLYAGTGAGVFKSVNGGQSWIPLNSGLSENRIVSSMTSDGAGAIIIGTYFSGVYRLSVDDDTWESINSNLPAGASVVNCLLVKDDYIFAAVDGEGLFVSTNNGSSWSEVSADLFGNGKIYTMSAIGDAILVGTSGSGVYRSEDNGQTWEAANEGLTSSNVFCMAVSGNDVFAGTHGGGIFHSEDYGSSWNRITYDETYYYLTNIAVYGTNIIASQWGNLILSTDFGATWTEIDLNGELAVQDFTVYEETLFAGTSNQGIFRSSNNGFDWEEVNSGLTATEIRSVLWRNEHLYAATDNGFFISTDNGTTWSPQNDGLESHQITCFTISDSGELFTGSYNDGVSYYSQNEQLWKKCVQNSSREVYVLLTKENYLFAATWPGALYRYEKQGSTWSETKTSLDAYYIISLAKGRNGDLYAGTFSEGVFKSSDNGTTWTEYNSGLTTEFVVSIEACSSGYVYAATDVGLFRRSPDEEQWTQIENESFRNGVIDLAISDDFIYALAVGNRVYMLPVDGTEWFDFNTGLDSVEAASISIGKNLIYITSKDRGVWRRPLSESFEVTSTKSPENYRSHQKLFTIGKGGYNSMLIQFSLPESKNVKIDVYNPGGRRVASLADAIFPEGQHTLPWNRGVSASGCYVIRMRSGGEVDLKMISVLP